MKMTQRDKMLLILLAVILVVALAVVFPGLGVMDSIEKKQKAIDDASALDLVLDEELEELKGMGVSVDTAADANLAKQKLEKEITALKEQGARFPETILEYSKNYKVNETWLANLEYRYGSQSTGEEVGETTTEEQIFDIKITEGESGIESEEFRVGDKLITLNYVKRKLTAKVLNDEYVYSPVNEEEESLVMESGVQSMKDLGALLLYLEHLSAKGAIMIDQIKKGSTTVSADAEGEVSTVTTYEIMIKVMMTNSSGTYSSVPETPETQEE